MSTQGAKLKTGIVVIGRNEGNRLVACLRSLAPNQLPVIYVDSGSTDGSLQQAKNLGAEVIELSMCIPFTAARARNAGLERLTEMWPALEYVQFVDGDCVVVDGWIVAAEAFLEEHPDAAVVCGRVREIHPDASVYNRLCDIEWDTPVGESTECGGIAMMRVLPLRKVDGFCEGLIAGEEPELCLRLREKGWKVWRLPVEMTLHDASIQRFGQWWKRTLRGGFAYGAVTALHAKSTRRIWHRELARAIFWGLILPLGILAASFLNIAALGLFLLYPLQIARIAFRRDIADVESWRYGMFMTIAKFAEAAGVLQYCRSRITRRQSRLLEYK